jgi:hypothetical protein
VTKDGTTFPLYNETLRALEKPPPFMQGVESIEVKVIFLPNHRESVAVTMITLGKMKEMGSFITECEKAYSAKMCMLDYHPH